MRRAAHVVLLVIFLLTACSGGPAPSTTPMPVASFPTPNATAVPQPGTSSPPDGGGSGTMASLPADIVAAVDRLVDAGTDAERTEAATAILASVGVTVSSDPDATPETNAGIVLDPDEVTSMAREAADRTLDRVSLADFAEAFGGMALLPPNDALAGDLRDDWDEVPPEEGDVGAQARAELQLGPLPAHLAGVVRAWVTDAIAAHGSSDPDLVELTNPPLLLAELARRRAVPLDLAQPFAADQLRLSALEVTLLVAGFRSMLTGVEASGIASADDDRSIVLAAQATGPMPRQAPAAAPTPCDTLKQMVDSRVPLATTVIKGYVGDQIKGFIQNFVNALYGEASAFAQSVGRSFKILSILLKVQALALLYSDSTARVEMDPSAYHKPDGDVMTAAATVTAGIDEAAWEAARQARELSPFSTALRVCARHLGLPVWQDLIDAGDAIDGWQVGWAIRQGSAHVRFNAREEFWGPGAVPGRQEKPLSRVNDHSGNDILGYEVLTERREDHPGTEMREPVELCATVYPKAPPGGFGTILSAGTAGASLASGSYLGLVGVIAGLLTAWVSAVHGIEGCGLATVSYHVPNPGAWHGTITANTERQESMSSTVSENNGPPWGTTVHTNTSRISVDVTDRYYLGGRDEAVNMGYVALDGRQYTNGAATEETSHHGSNVWSPSGCGYDVTEVSNSGGGWYFDAEGSASISLYADGRYTISFYAAAPDDEVIAPGEKVTQISLREGGCIDTGSGTEDWPFWPSPLVGTPPSAMIEGRLDPEDPGNVLRGQMSITELDGSVSTITWNIVHDGPIHLPQY